MKKLVWIGVIAILSALIVVAIRRKAIERRATEPQSDEVQVFET